MRDYINRFIACALMAVGCALAGVPTLPILIFSSMLWIWCTVPNQWIYAISVAGSIYMAGVACWAVGWRLG